MTTRGILVPAWTLLPVLVAACNTTGVPGLDAGGAVDGSSTTADAGAPDAGAADGGGTDAGAPDGACGLPAPVLDCTDAGTCPELVIQGDHLASSAFRAIADPSVRRDPASGRLWLQYSWAHVLATDGGPTQSLDIHLAHSDDNGNTWIYDTPLWRAALVTNPINGLPNYTSHEVSNLWPLAVDGGTVWASIHLDYLVPLGGPLTSQLLAPVGKGTGNFAITTATTPTDLANPAHPVATLGFVDTAPQIPVTLSLPSLDPVDGGDLSRCLQMAEPAFFQQADTLYLALDCRTTSFGIDNSFYTVFATHPEAADPLDATTWTWQYRGKFAERADALALGGDYLIEMELALAADGSLVSIVSPASVSMFQGQPTQTTKGCKVVRMASLDPPAFATGCDGGLDVIADIEELDADAGLRSGACTYERGATTGMLIAPVLANGSGYQVTLQRTSQSP